MNNRYESLKYLHNLFYIDTKIKNKIASKLFDLKILQKHKIKRE